MIIGSIIEGVLNVLLFPVEVINVGVNFFLGIDWVVDIVSVIAYVLPWSSLIPLISLIILITGFKIVISIIKTIWDLLPLV